MNKRKKGKKERKLIFNSMWIQQKKIQLKWIKKEMFCCFINQK